MLDGPKLLEMKMIMLLLGKRAIYIVQTPKFSIRTSHFPLFPSVSPTSDYEMKKSKKNAHTIRKTTMHIPYSGFKKPKHSIIVKYW